MGVCFECRVEIDGAPHQRACMIPAREAMRVCTDA
jgi:sarcosine oxidase subunit alpha